MNIQKNQPAKKKLPISIEAKVLIFSRESFTETQQPYIKADSKSAKSILLKLLESTSSKTIRTSDVSVKSVVTNYYE